MEFTSPFKQPFVPRQRERRFIGLDLGGHRSQLPVIRIDGYAEGPSLLVTAGIHGAEYPGIEALVRLGSQLSGDEFRGRLVMVPISNTAAFAERSAFVTPPDGRNLNRMFPGRPRGSYTEQLAHVLVESFMVHADAYIDLHSGDLVEALFPFSSYATTGNSDVDSASARLATAFGFTTIIKMDAAERGSLSHVAASLRGVPSLLAEIGGQGVWSDADVDRFIFGIRSVMAETGMTASPEQIADDATTYNAFDWYFADADGLWYPHVATGDRVARGQILGEVRTVFGEPIQQVVADADGLNVFMLTALSARRGDPLVGTAGQPD